ncbi:CREB-regulated transcription coactivator 2-like isoform X2 [Astyanax mexicanus]|uniref:CREB-regulated transcription coactivator 2-like isoform X2 n=1 Tax=Astyanax mexicanus TaxID=7994 RepID=A0A8T2M6T8_ASTMX|nr:CREB-regulated transcription coactivator 2-like isoform X2 [Astyanax mexicanus]
MAGAGAGAAAGPGQWSFGGGGGGGGGGGSPRKFSEKIALHTQRQAEDTAAFREVMMDITSTRIQAQRLRQVRSLASYYGGSLPNVNQISKCSTESQDHLRLDHGHRDHRPIPLGRPSRRHTDSTPYLSLHLSPPTGPSWRRQWSMRPVNERSQLDQLPVTTLNRTNSDSALHTSVKITSNMDSNSTQVLTACSRKTGTPLFRRPVPLIEETVQEEGRPLKSQKMSSVLSGCDNPGNGIFPSPDLSCPLTAAPSLSTCGSLPDLSSLHLPSAGPEAIYPEPQSHATSLNSPTGMHPMSGTAAHSANITDSLSSSSLQTSTSNPLLQSSLSNPNLQTALSSHSLVEECFSSASLSLSNSSLQSSLSSHSLQSSLSSSSLSNQSVQSAASFCSYSSGIGGSSSSLSCSPHTSGQGMVPRNASSWKRSQLNPLMVPSGGEPVWQQPKQLMPNMSPTFYPMTQGVPLDSTKVSQEAKPSMYHQPTSHAKMYQPVHQHCQPDVWDQSRQNARKQCQHQVLPQSSSQSKPQPQYPHHSHSKVQPRLLNPQNYVSQQQLHEQKTNLQHCQQNQQTQYQQTLHQQCQPAQQYLQQHPQPQPYPHQHTHPLHYQQQYQIHNQCWNPQQLMHHSQSQHQYQYQGQPEGPPRPFPEQQQFPPPSIHEITSQKKDHQHNPPSTGAQGPPEACMRIKELPSKDLQSKMPVIDPRRERTTLYHKGVHSQRDHLQPSEVASTSDLDEEFQLHNESYVGLQLTPSQAEALSQKLGQLHKVPDDVTKYQEVEEEVLPVEGLGGLSSSSIAVSFPWLDDDLPDLPDSIPEFDLEPFVLED